MSGYRLHALLNTHTIEHYHCLPPPPPYDWALPLAPPPPPPPHFFPDVKMRYLNAMINETNLLIIVIMYETRFCLKGS